MADADHTVLRGDSGVLLRVENGTVIGYDATGLTLRLSDTVVSELRVRLGVMPGATAAAGWIDPGVLGDIDAWNVVRQGEWYHFDGALTGYDHPRRFRRPVAGGHVVAEAAGPLMAVLSIGGARRAWAVPGRAAFPAHVLCPGDDIGAVGVAGVEPALATAALERAREVTVDVLLAAALLARRQAAGRALPLFVTRCETDRSGSAGDLATGMAIANLEQVIDNVVAAADSLGVAARIVAVALDYGAEDVVSDFEGFVAGMRAVMVRITARLAALGLPEAVFVMRSDETGARVREHWQLSVFADDHRLVFAAPGYAFEFDENHRPTAAAMVAMAEAEADAIEAAMARAPRHCPRLLLAEAEGAGLVRVTTDALTPLVLDAALGAGADHGFALVQDGCAAALSGVAIAPDDPCAVILRHGAAGPLEMHFAVGRAGGVRDDSRWALPAILKVAGC